MGGAPVAVPPVMVSRIASAQRPIKAFDLQSVLAKVFAADKWHSPVQSPLSWMVAAAALGQLGVTRTSSPTALPAAAVGTTLVVGTPKVGSPRASTGVVTGAAVFRNSGGGVLSYGAPPTSAGGGALTVNSATGAFSYTPTQAQRQAADSNTTDQFTVTATNGKDTALQTISVRVDPGALSAGTPVVGNASIFSGQVAGWGRARDSVGRVLTYSASPTSVGGGSVSVDPVTGRFTYTPTTAQRSTADLMATDTFELTASNGRSTVTQTITVPVHPGFAWGAAPKAGKPNATTGQVRGSVQFTDSTGRPLTITAPGSSAGGATVTIDSATGAFVYTPTAAQRAASDNGAVDTFTVTADNGLRATTQTITVKLNGTPAVGRTDTYLVVDRADLDAGSVNGMVRVRNGAGVSYSAPVSTVGGGTVSINSASGRFTYTPTEAQRLAARPDTTDTFVVTAYDGLRTLTQTVTVSVSGLNSPPTGSATANAPDATTGVVTGAVLGNDPNGDSLTYTGPGSTGRGSVAVANDGGFTYTPTSQARHNAAADAATEADRTDGFAVTISDGRGGTAVVPVAVTIAGANANPTGSVSSGAPDGATGAVSGAVSGSDADNDGLTYQLTGAPTNGTVTVDPNTGAFVYTPSEAARQALQNAGEGPVAGTGVQTLTLDGPAVTQGTFRVGTPYFYGEGPRNYAVAYFTATETQPYVFGNTASPADTVMFVYNAGSFDPASPTANVLVFSDDESMQGQFGNCGGGFGSCPEARVNLRAGQTVELVTSTFSSGDERMLPLTVYSNGPGVLSATVPTPPPASSDSFTVTINDGHGGQTAVRVSVPITAAVSAPVAVSASPGSPDSATGVVTGTVTFTDPNGRTLSYSAPATSAGGGSVSVDPETGDFVYTPTQAQRQAAVLAGGGGSASPTLGAPTVKTVANGLGSNTVNWINGSGSTLYVATNSGLSISTDGGATFTNRTTDNGLGGNAVFQGYGDGGKVYAATYGGGLGISTDGGNTFTSRTTSNGLGSDVVFGTYANGGNVYAATYGGGLGISADGGNTFTSRTTGNGLGSNNTFKVQAVGSNVYVATDAGLAVSTDGGGTFSNRTTANGLGADYVYGVAVDGSKVYAATYGGGLGVSTDGGITFTSRTTANGLGSNNLYGVYANGDTVYAATENGLSVSTDGGNTFVNATAADGLSGNLVLGVHGSGSTVYAGTGGGLSIVTVQGGDNGTGAASTDTFTITASNGIRTASQTVSVTVDPGTPVAGTPTVGNPRVTGQTYNASFLAPTPDGTNTFVNTSLREVVDVTGTLGGAYIGNGNAAPYFFSNDGTSATVQLQVEDGGYTKCVKVLLTQSGSDIVSSVVYAKYTGGNVLGTDFDTTGYSQTIAEDSGWGGYGVRSLTITTDVVSGSAAFTDTAGRSLTFSAPSTSTGGGAVSVNAATGEFTYTPTAAQYRSATGSTTDTFTVTASNGVRSTSQTVTVKVTAVDDLYQLAAEGVDNVDYFWGTVNGHSALFADNTGRPVTYSADARTTLGGSVYVNPSTGYFVYNPDWWMPSTFGGGQDYFLVSATNGLTTQQTWVYVPIVGDAYADPFGGGGGGGYFGGDEW